MMTKDESLKRIMEVRANARKVIADLTKELGRRPTNQEAVDAYYHRVAHTKEQIEALVFGGVTSQILHAFRDVDGADPTMN